MGKIWIGVDLDGTLAHYDGWKGSDHIGSPIPRMVQRVKEWLAEGIEVRIFTARVCGLSREGWTPEQTRKHIQNWCKFVFGQELKVTCIKDMDMVQLWDDRAVAVEKNTGRNMVNGYIGEL
jgi:hypothetical protein